VIQWEPAWDPRRVRWRGTDDGAAARQVWLGAPPSQRRTRAGGPWPACPVGFLTSLAHAGASFTDAHGEQHPSHRTTWQCSPDPPTASPVTPVPSHQGISPTWHANCSTLAGFTGYSEDLPSVCFTGCSASDRRYARNHKRSVDFANLPQDLAALPTVAVVVPNLCPTCTTAP